jgi:hypothetical protein
MSFLKKESGGLLKKRWDLNLEKQFKETLLLVSHWTCALVGVSEISHSLGGIFWLWCHLKPLWLLLRRESRRDSTARL